MANAHPPADTGKYYVPHGSPWPFFGSVALFVLMSGAALTLEGGEGVPGSYVLFFGLALIAVLFFGWFGKVIEENQAGMYNLDVDRSFRMGMMWFIFSEVMFFAAFFGALFYARNLSVPWLSGDGAKQMTHNLLWGHYEGGWPTNGPARLGPHENGSFETVPALGLQLGTGIYGSTFFMLTGFHGLHVTIGAIMLTVIWFRTLKGHFTPERHFAFEAVAWYWHFVDVVWLGLFIFVYWL